MKKLVPDPPAYLLALDVPAVTLATPPAPMERDLLVSALTLTLVQTANVLIDSPPGLRRDAMGMSMRVMCAVLNAVMDHPGLKALENRSEVSE
ncbi:hypothetical protein D3C76_940690 [compost metagenome]|uniref:hypothetical protein n=1 Tax=Pseudomonas sp. GM84 TaxID=1144340 RepID=UPI00026F5678|nr:hypothetical protein [Pseudomonas sp. GM84]EJN36833.1 hypothetical protein PMI38_03734 [Pseudomonas sp. GM84]